MESGRVLGFVLPPERSGDVSRLGRLFGAAAAPIVLSGNRHATDINGSSKSPMIAPHIPVCEAVAVRIPMLLSAFVLALTTAQASAQSDKQFAIIFNNTKNDGGFNELALQGLQRLKAEAKVDARENIIRTEEDSIRSMRTFAEFGIRNILLIGFINERAVEVVAKEFPDIHFTIIDGRVDLPNVRSVLFREDEAAYLVGVAAGLASRSGTVGFVGAMPIPPIKRFECGYVQGVLAARPDARIIRRYLGDDPRAFRDKEKAQQTTDALTKDGVDVTFAAAGYAGGGVLEGAAQAGRLGIGVDTNQNGVFPGKILTSAVKRVDVAVYQAFKDAHNGVWTGGVQQLGLAQDGVGWARDSHNAALVADIGAKIDEAAAAIKSGAVTVLSPDRAPACL